MVVCYCVKKRRERVEQEAECYSGPAISAIGRRPVSDKGLLTGITHTSLRQNKQAGRGVNSKAEIIIVPLWDAKWGSMILDTASSKTAVLVNCVVVFTFWKCFTAGKGKAAFNVFPQLHILNAGTVLCYVRL